ncbi:helix-turn-helix transcriptional regulator [Pleurocapsales cyanobacterium LEGE 06147]|nr:helix-turn-helix transcriptional regulator [Pleurocapsales cyanobacterium LEGE 06147]
MPTRKPLQTSDLIRELRRQFNLSQEKFAARLGVSFKTVNRWENGHTTPSPMALKLIAELVKEIGKPGITLLDRHFLEQESQQCPSSTNRNRDSL